MGSRRVQAMAKLIDDVARMAYETPCVHHGRCLPCEISERIHGYRREKEREKGGEATVKESLTVRSQPKE